MIIMVYNNFETIDCATNARLLVGVGVGLGWPWSVLVAITGHLTGCHSLSCSSAATPPLALPALPPGRVPGHVVIVINGH